MIHKYCINGIFIVLDINSGAVHQVDETVYELLGYWGKTPYPPELLAKYSNEELDEAADEINLLVAEGTLFSEDIDKSLLNAGAAATPIVKALCLHVAHDCNLKCRYCFASEGSYQGSRSLMSVETGKKAIDFIISNSGTRRNLEIDFFGGEPTLNMETVRAVVEYGRMREKESGKRFRFTLTTNGLLLDEDKKQYINENMNNVVLSIDGRKHVNDNNRARLDGKGSYDTILPKFKELADSRKQDNYYVRGTYTRNNTDFACDVLHLADEGFKQISIEPVVAPPDKEYAIREADLPALTAEYESLAVKMAERGNDFNFFHFMIDLTGGPCVKKRVTGCGAGTEYLAVTPEGKLYPCHQFVGETGYEIGSLDEGILNHELRERFGACNVFSKPECGDCFAKYYCSGGCMANAYLANGDILTPYKIGCELMKKRIECAIYLKVLAANGGECI